MEEAARSLGASELTVFRRIVLPNILPGILSGVTMAFARAVGEIGAVVDHLGQPARTSTEVASVFIFNQIAERQPGRRRRGRGRPARDLVRRPARVGGIRRSATRHERA